MGMGKHANMPTHAQDDKIRLTRKFNSLQKQNVKKMLSLGTVPENEDYKGKYLFKEEKRSPKSGLFGPFAKTKK